MKEHDQYRTASYQGEHVGLRLNRQAIDDLRDVLDGLSPGSSRRSGGRVRVRLPDGRDLTLTVAVTDDGAVRDVHGEWVGDDGLAHGDVTGDLGRHHDAAQVIEAVTRTGYLDLPLPGDEPQEFDGGWLERRDRDVIDGAVGRLAARHAYGSASDRRWVQQLRDRAEQAAAATRTGRLAQAQRMAEQLAAARRQRRGQTAGQSLPGSQPAM
jgi:hypothetical protein